MQANQWLLPDGVQETLPPQSWQLEQARRQLLDTYWRWGYDLIRPAMIEYIGSLLTGTGKDLELQTFQVVDQLSGRMMGIRSDLTTQTARIDARRMHKHGPGRYCYIGSVLRTRPEELGGSRTPLQIGTEIFGETGLAGELEAIALMLETFDVMHIDNVKLDLGHVAIYQRLIARSGVPSDLEPQVFEIIQRKSRPDLDALHANHKIDLREYQWLTALIELHGSSDVLAQAEQKLGGIDEEIDHAIAHLYTVVEHLQARYPQVPIMLDLAELRGYQYKTGLVFAAFVPDMGRELARGGRYDKVSAAFGRARPAVGFSADLNLLAATGQTQHTEQAGIYAPADTDAELLKTVRQLRQQGQRVVVAIPGDQASAAELGCHQTLAKDAQGQWQITQINQKG